ncbi:helicase RepA family protein [Anaerotruncus sp. DFI.9.16]|uniref:AAA family ATPase n=1 Tax=Anaerotruncus sp. DFI.9.16 TaxID=2965275 RepID=UPI00210A7CC5|nr:helicase RepA family protein [Anaerotruncus sp. DFI.9.16]MCQ4896719.1 helicase RepA family protein [Anaerotruncus sp. DFI.9.16]
MMIEANEKTALVPSVGADERQSIQTNSENSIPTSEQEINDQIENSEESLEEMYRRMQRLNDPAYLPTVTMQELYENVYQSRPPIIDGLLYSGTYLFAGAPKVGKSFFMAQLAYHISTGEKLWDYEVHQGTVLYLALEDDYQRLQERMFRMFGVEGTDKLHFAVYAKQLGNGLDEQLERFVKEHPDTKLIIIDTLQKVRELGGEAYSYADDYQIVGKFKQFADRKGVCMLVVHHTRKTPAGDKFEMISGITGLLGCADGAFVLQKEKRTDSAAILDVVGRDQPDQRIHLVRDEERLIWCFDHADRELWIEPPDSMLVAIEKLLTLESPMWQGSATELIAALGMDILPNALTKKLNVKASKLWNDFHIQYKNEHTRSGSRIILTLAKAAV